MDYDVKNEVSGLRVRTVARRALHEQWLFSKNVIERQLILSERNSVCLTILFFLI